MPVLLQVNHLHKAYGANIILDDAIASFSSDQKIGVIGRNGAGKSTLCRIITGHETADSGTITRNTELRLAYLEQHDSFHANETVLDFLMRQSGREHWECGAMAAQFKITNDQLTHVVSSLPGGFQTRVKLTAMLLTDPNFLVMDEPSNYLDLSTLVLLENFLIGFRGGYLIVSHDREFLKRTCDHTLEVESSELTLYPGDIEEYFEFKESELEQAKAYNKGVEKKREQLKAFVDRFRAKASTASRAQSKLKQMEKLKTIEIGHSLGTVRIYIPKVEPKRGVALTAKDLAIGYPEKDVATKIHFMIDRGQRVAVLGDNGEGKSTFLKTLAGELPPKAGSFRWSASLQTAYFAQHVYSSLHPEDDIYSHLLRMSAPEVTSQEILNLAGCFLFKGNDTKKKVKVLSGGERARLCLAGLLLSKSQVLLLDEPTNHLDFETVEALGRALKSFAGTVFFISHDRTFVQLVATQILEVKGGQIRHYPGTYEDYVYSLEQAAREDRKEASVERSSHSSASTSGETRPVRHEDPHKKDHKAELSKLRKKMAGEEAHLGALTKERDQLLEKQAKNPFHFSKERNLRLKEIQVQMEETEKTWYDLQKKFDQLKEAGS